MEKKYYIPADLEIQKISTKDVCLESDPEGFMGEWDVFSEEEGQ